MNPVPKAQDTRQHILEVALDRFLRLGHAQVSLRQIAADVGITPMAIYRHFPNKETLQEELIGSGFAVFTAYLRRGEAETTARERLLRMADGFMAFAIENGAYFELMFLTAQPAAGLKTRQSVLEVSRPAFDLLHDCAGDYLREQARDQVDSLRFAQSLLAASVGYAALYISQTFGWSQESACKHFRAAVERLID